MGLVNFMKVLSPAYFMTVTASTSKYLRKYLENTVELGTAHKAYIEGYSIAGKTGTAQKIPRADLKWVISFIGHAPADDPKFAIYIVLDEPDGTTGTSGSTSDALILAKDIMTELLPYMNVYKDTDEPYVDPGNTPEESGVSDVPVSEPAATGSN
jgi:stage V sporulation protein D (sporulation-specific penicillin-binding protein)